MNIGHGNWRKLNTEVESYGSQLKNQPQKYKLRKDALRITIHKYKERQDNTSVFRSDSDESDDDDKKRSRN